MVLVADSAFSSYYVIYSNRRPRLNTISAGAPTMFPDDRDSQILLMVNSVQDEYPASRLIAEAAASA